MTLDDLLEELSERGWELSLHGPALGQWEAYVRAWTDDSRNRVSAVGHARNHNPLSAVSDAMERCERDPEWHTFVPDTSAIAPSSGSILEKLGLAKPSEPIKRRA